MSTVERFAVDDQEVIRTTVRASMTDGAILHGYRYQIETPAPGRRDLVALPQVSGCGLEYQRGVLRLLTEKNGPARVFTFDLRGRGLSYDIASGGLAYASDSDDVISFCDALGLHHFDLLASGHSALIALLTTQKRPGMIRKLILNDGAPLFDGVGIARSKTTFHRATQPKDWEQALSVLRDLKGQNFPALSDTDWEELSRIQWQDHNGTPVPSIDKPLFDDFSSIDFEGEQEDLWPEWAILAKRPVLLIRGENSAMVTQPISDQMAKAHSGLRIKIASGQGHVPLLHVGDLVPVIANFLSDRNPTAHPDQTAL